MIDLTNLTSSELEAIIRDVEQIDPAGDGYLTECGEHISFEMHVAASRLLPITVHRERSAKGGRGKPPKDRVKAEIAITRLLVEDGRRPLSFKAIYEEAGVIEIFDRRSKKIVKDWVKNLPAWSGLSEEYRNRVGARGRRPN